MSIVSCIISIEYLGMMTIGGILSYAYWTIDPYNSDVVGLLIGMMCGGIGMLAAIDRHGV